MVVLILDLINSSAVPNEMETANRKTEMGKGKIENGKWETAPLLGSWSWFMNALMGSAAEATYRGKYYQNERKERRKENVSKGKQR